MAQCGLSPSERFSFYDHVHTTGMDIKQPPGARAMLTMNKDSTTVHVYEFVEGCQNECETDKILENLASTDSKGCFGLSKNAERFDDWRQFKPFSICKLIHVQDTSLRDFSQGAFRMRQLGKGQTVTILVTPEACRSSGKRMPSCGVIPKFSGEVLRSVKGDKKPFNQKTLMAPGESPGGAMSKRLSSRATCHQPRSKQLSDIG